MHRNQSTHFWLSCSLFSSSTISLGSRGRNSPPAPPALHSFPLIEQWATSLHYYRKLLFLPYGKMPWVCQLQAKLETPGLVADILKEERKECMNSSFIHSLNICWISNMYQALFRGDAAVDKTENTFWDQNESLMFKVISCCIILFCILEAGYYFILSVCILLWKNPSLSPVKCPLRWWLCTQKGRRKTILIIFKILS